MGAEEIGQCQTAVWAAYQQGPPLVKVGDPLTGQIIYNRHTATVGIAGGAPLVEPGKKFIL